MIEHILCRIPKSFDGKILDLGIGSGAILFALCSSLGSASGIGIDKSERALSLARENLLLHELMDRVELRQLDWFSEKIELGVVDLIVSNPPFFAASDGPASPDPWRAAARTESTATLPLFLTRACEALNENGRICMVVPRERATEAEQSAAALGLFLRRRCEVGARRVLLSWRTQDGPCSRVVLHENSERVISWYERFGAAHSA